MSLPRLTRFRRHCLTCLVIFAVMEILIFNFTVVFLVWTLKDIVAGVSNSPGSNIFDKLGGSPVFQSIIKQGKDGGLQGLIQETLGRLYIESSDTGYKQVDNMAATEKLKQVAHEKSVDVPRLSQIGIDVSKAGESLYVYRRMLQRFPWRWKKLVVDIGANDGLLSSNSYNFIQRGWSAVLVDPLPHQLQLARNNLQRYIDKTDEGSQIVHFVAGVVGERDGRVRLVVGDDVVSRMESHVFDEKDDACVKCIDVMSYTVRTLAANYAIPKDFGLLSIDAEGSSKLILRQWIALDYRPAYIIIEELHEKETTAETTDFLKKHGYQHLTRRGWNSIYEYTKYNES